MNLRERAEILTLKETDGIYRWEKEKAVWCRYQETGKKNLFSKVGVGAAGAEILLREMPVDLTRAMRGARAVPIPHRYPEGGHSTPVFEGAGGSGVAGDGNGQPAESRDRRKRLPRKHGGNGGGMPRLPSPRNSCGAAMRRRRWKATSGSLRSHRRF